MAQWPNGRHYRSARLLYWRLLVALISLNSTGLILAQGPTLKWVRQLGTPLVNEAGVDGEEIAGISLDGLGNLYVAGGTYGNLGGPTMGGEDVFLAKFGVAGNQQWIRQIGGTSQQRSTGVSADALGNVFLVHKHAPTDNWVVSNYNGLGNEVWFRQGVLGGAISADDAGNAYAAGTTGGGATNDDGLLVKYNAAGDQIWSHQFGTDDYDQSWRVSADSAGNVFPYGHSLVSGSKTRVILARFDSSGNEQWTRLLESARVVNPGGVVADGLGNVYISGSSNAPIAEPRTHQGYDAFVAKYDALGNRVWISEFGTSDSGEHAGGVAIDGLGNVYVTGSTGGSLGGQNAGEGDVFLSKFDVDGNQLWIHQFGTTANDAFMNHIVSDGLGNVYVAGLTRGDLGGTYSGGGGYDFFIAKFSDPVPEPPAGFLLLMAAVTVVTYRRARR